MSDAHLISSHVHRDAPPDEINEISRYGPIRISLRPVRQRRHFHSARLIRMQRSKKEGLPPDAKSVARSGARTLDLPM